ncbi:MAG: SusD/RagB family nutrient-binding outer membrane lipoprotein [Ekhidna sp.]|nr:SusD/RagB family nutrient-binding outer membrane lipoprotein [Ekhidna sp.]
MIILLVSGVLLSCEDYLADINEDPNKSASVPLTALLPQIQIQMADVYGGTYSRYSSLYIQQVEGVARQWVTFNQYGALPEDFDAVWGDIYENIIVELKPIEAEAKENGYNHYLGIVKVLEANALMMLTDYFGDIPYTEAGLGSEGLNDPVYDDQKTIIYPKILELLNEAATLLRDDVGTLVPSNDDLYYKGKAASWLKAIEAIKARYYLHLGEYSNALTAAQASFKSASDNLSYMYTEPPNGAPWYRFNDGRTGDLEFHPTMRALMTGLNDTKRLSVMDKKFVTTHPYLVAAYEQELISYREIQFIIAEALFRTSGNDALLRTAYQNGIKASFEELGLTTTDYNSYIGQPAVDPGEGLITLKQIMTQKYIALFVQPEAFADWRRTGTPSLTPVSGDKIPRRFKYPLNEILFNAKGPKENSDRHFEGVDWDNNN